MPLVYAVQLNIVWESKAANHAAARSLIESANIAPGSLIALPEMFDTGFSMDVDKIADTIGAPLTREFLCEMARQTRCTLIGGRVVKDAQGRGINQAIVIAPDGSELACYHKQRPFFANEAKCFSAGKSPIAFEYAGLKTSVFICYDLRFPELFREAAIGGAELIVVIANWPSVRVDHWNTLLRARAIENQCYVLAVNRCGKDPTLRYPGRSMIIDPRGAILADLPAKPGVLAGEISAEIVRTYRNEFLALADARMAGFIPPSSSPATISAG